jgi:hypothetical protein
MWTIQSSPSLFPFAVYPFNDNSIEERGKPAIEAQTGLFCCFPFSLLKFQQFSSTDSSPLQKKGRNIPFCLESCNGYDFLANPNQHGINMVYDIIAILFEMMIDERLFWISLSKQKFKSMICFLS